MAFDRHMNIVLGDAEEFRKIKAKKGTGISEEKEEKRALGLIILRGDSVVSLTIEGYQFILSITIYTHVIILVVAWSNISSDDNNSPLKKNRFHRSSSTGRGRESGCRWTRGKMIYIALSVSVSKPYRAPSLLGGMFSVVYVCMYVCLSCATCVLVLQVSKAAGRGMPIAPLAGVGAPLGLAGPVRGVGGPSMAMMQPQMEGTEAFFVRMYVWKKRRK